MGDTMTFPKTVEEFMEEYKIVDSDQVYTNGAELVPIFRMKQWFEHINATSDAVFVCRCKDCKHRPTKPDDYNPITTDGFALEFPDEKCPCQCSDGWYSKYPDDDWYCPIGERKGGMSDGLQSMGTP